MALCGDGAEFVYRGGIQIFGGGGLVVLKACSEFSDVGKDLVKGAEHSHHFRNLPQTPKAWAITTTAESWTQPVSGMIAPGSLRSAW